MGEFLAQQMNQFNNVQEQTEPMKRRYKRFKRMRDSGLNMDAAVAKKER